MGGWGRKKDYAIATVAKRVSRNSTLQPMTVVAKLPEQVTEGEKEAAGTKQLYVEDPMEAFGQLSGSAD